MVGEDEHGSKVTEEPYKTIGEMLSSVEVIPLEGAERIGMSEGRNLVEFVRNQAIESWKAYLAFRDIRFDKEYLIEF